MRCRAIRRGPSQQISTAHSAQAARTNVTAVTMTHHKLENRGCLHELLRHSSPLELFILARSCRLLHRTPWKTSFGELQAAFPNSHLVLVCSALHTARHCAFICPAAWFFVCSVVPKRARGKKQQGSESQCLLNTLYSQGLREQDLDADSRHYLACSSEAAKVKVQAWICIWAMPVVLDTLVAAFPILAFAGPFTPP